MKRCVYCGAVIDKRSTACLAHVPVLKADPHYNEARR